MTTIPLAAGLTLATLIAEKWPGVIRIAQVVGAVAALATITMTIEARFDAVSTVALSVMHIVIAVSVVLALQTLAHRQAARRRTRTDAAGHPGDEAAVSP